jgi:hypothetical protein
MVGGQALLGQPVSRGLDAWARLADDDLPTPDSHPFVELARSVLGDDWRVVTDGSWCAALPPEPPTQRQAWLLHVSAAPHAAYQVLDQALPVLREYEAAFTFAADDSLVAWLTSRDRDPETACRFLTVYPRDDEQAPRLAADLDAATQDLPGPRIVADRTLRPGSLVHYRYGSFQDTYELDDDGVLRPVLVAPDGSRVEDRRDIWRPPTWASSPFDSRTDEAATDERPRPRALLRRGDVVAERYVVAHVVRQHPAGGVYVARDQRTDQDVILKHSRAYTDVSLDDSGGDGGRPGRTRTTFSAPDGVLAKYTDGHDRLQREASMLEFLSGQAPVPRLVELFDDGGDRYLATERLPGCSLLRWTKSLTSDPSDLGASRALLIARRLVALLASVHSAGVALGDLGPTSILVGTNGSLSLVDLESATIIGTQGIGTQSRGRGNAAGRTHGPESDLWQLGALLFLLGTGMELALPDDEPADRLLRDRVAAVLRTMSRDYRAAEVLAPAVLGLLAPTAQCRWSLSRVESYLANPHRRASPLFVARVAIPTPSVDRLINDGLVALCETAARSDTDEVTNGTSRGTDPFAVRHGLAGVLGTLVQGARTRPDVGGDGGLMQAIRDAASAVAGGEPPGEIGRVLPGLWTGRAGIAVALADAGHVLAEAGDADEGWQLVSRGVEIIHSLPTTWPVPGVAHGLAGAGLASLQVLRRWRDFLEGDRPPLDTAPTEEARVDDPRQATDPLLGQALAIADHLQRAVVDGPHGLLWRIPNDAWSRMAGACHYGFAHGVAGIGYLLLAVSEHTGDESYAKLARELGHTLCQATHIDADGAAWWPVGPDDRAPVSPLRSDSAGVGTFLLRLYAATGEPAIGAYASAAALAAYKGRWQDRPDACCHLADCGHYLLDAAQLLGDDPYRSWAEDLAEAMAVRHCRRKGRLLLGPEPRATSNAVSFLLRLQDAGPRPWLPDIPTIRTMPG